MWNTVGIGEHPQYAWLDEQCIFLPDTDEYVDAAGQTPLYTACYNGHTNWKSKNTDFTGEASVRNYRQTSSTNSNWISKNTDFTGEASVRNYRQTSSTNSNWISKNTDFTGVASVRNYRQT